MKAYLEPKEVSQMEEAASYLRDKLLIRVLFHLGCRVSEALSLTVENVDFGRGRVTIKHLKATSENRKSYPVDLTIGSGHMITANPDEKGEVVVKADSGDEFAYVRIDGSYLADVMRAFGGMVDFSLSKPYSPMLFSADGFQVVVMPLMSNRANEEQRADTEAKKAEAEPTVEDEPTEDIVEDIAVDADAEPTEAELEAIEAEAQPKAQQTASLGSVKPQ